MHACVSDCASPTGCCERAISREREKKTNPLSVERENFPIGEIFVNNEKYIVFILSCIRVFFFFLFLCLSCRMIFIEWTILENGDIGDI